jgi:hypothetical protein
MIKKLLVRAIKNALIQVINHQNIVICSSDDTNVTTLKDSKWRHLPHHLVALVVLQMNAVHLIALMDKHSIYSHVLALAAHLQTNNVRNKPKILFLMRMLALVSVDSIKRIVLKMRDQPFTQIFVRVDVDLTKIVAKTQLIQHSNHLLVLVVVIRVQRPAQTQHYQILIAQIAHVFAI